MWLRFFSETWCLLLVSWISLSLASEIDFEKSDPICGISPKARMPIRQRGKNRVINGYTPNQYRPWMVSLLVRGSTCGGSIVAPNKVLTAGHCVCGHFVQCSQADVGVPKVVTQVSGFTAHLGAMAVKDQMTFNVIKIVVHSNYQNDVQPKPHDVAMLTLDRSIKFTDMARPICFPKPNIEENSIKVFTAGWGTVRDKAGDYDSCVSNQFGPMKFKGCQGKCITLKSPPQKMICKDFFKAGGMDEGINIALINLEDGSSELCYNNGPGPEGWCPTAQPVGLENWGFCMPSCNEPAGYRDHKSRILKEVDLWTFAETTCYPGSVEVGQEICMGGKLEKPVIGTYVKNGDGFALQTRTPPKEFYDFFGYKDSCQGDSGGPVWKNVFDDGGERAMLFGTISRGAKCADKNMPGIVVRVSQHVDWIYEHAGIKAGGVYYEPEY